MPCTFNQNRPEPFEDFGPGCQFEGSGLLTDFWGEGDHRCPFHLPPDVVDGRGRMKREWGEEDIETFNNAVIQYIARAIKKDTRVDLTGVIFPGAISFKSFAEAKQELPPISFSNAKFSDHTEFTGVKFSAGTTFFEAHFGDSIDFRNAVFGDGVSFQRGQFGKSVTFAGATFGKGVNFVSAQFGTGAKFTKTTFGPEARFMEAKFVGSVTFETAQFGKDALFIQAQLGPGSQFGEAVFDDGLSFEWATFGDGIKFGHVRFGKRANFKGAMFGDNIVFDDSHFGGQVNFSARTPDPTPHLERTRFLRIGFRGVCFKDVVTFGNRKFESFTDFSNAVFGVAPDFHGCSLHQATFFTGAKFLDRTDGEVEIDAASAYRTLKLAMEEKRARTEQARFFALEQKALRASGQIKGWNWLFSWLYEKTAEYGQSFIRPLVCLLFASAVFLPLYLWIDASCVGVDQIVCPNGTRVPDIGDNLNYTFQQLFLPFEPFRERASGNDIPFAKAILAGFHSVLNFTFLALFLLALRWRFKRD